MTSASGRARVRFPLLAAALLLVVLAAAGRPGDTGAETVDPSSPQAQRLLRLPDLQIGYFELLGECARLRAPDGPPKLAAFIARYRPAGCLVLYLRGFEVEAGDEPDPVAAGSAVLHIRSAKGADVAWKLLPRVLVSEGFGDPSLEEVSPSGTVGEAARMFHAPSIGLGGATSTFLLWRSGNTLALVFTDGGSIAANDRDALALARRQQVHVESPTPYTPAESDDTEVALDDPGLKVPVPWLGRGFHPAAGLPASQLLAAYVIKGRRHSALEQVELTYSHRLALDSWTPAGFKHYLATTPGARRRRGSPCTTPSVVSLPQGRAKVYAGYRGNPTSCPDRRPDTYRADVFLGGVVVQIDPVDRPYSPPPEYGERPALPPPVLPCRTCPRHNPPVYDSRRGVLAIARSLRLRVPRAPRGVPVPTP